MEENLCVAGGVGSAGLWKSCEVKQNVVDGCGDGGRSNDLPGVL